MQARSYRLPHGYTGVPIAGLGQAEDQPGAVVDPATGGRDAVTLANFLATAALAEEVDALQCRVCAAEFVAKSALAVSIAIVVVSIVRGAR